MNDAAPTDAGSSAEISTKATDLAAEIETSLRRGEIDVLTSEALQALMAALCRTYTAQVEMGSKAVPLPEATLVNATDAMTTASGLLRAANVASFEFAMWQSWGGH